MGFHKARQRDPHLNQPCRGIEFPLYLACFLSVALCSALAGASVKGPRVAFTAQQCVKIDERKGRRLDLPPYWTPTPGQIRRVESMVIEGSRELSHLPYDLAAYGFQYFGVTKNGRKVIYINAFCPAHWEKSQQSYWETDVVFVLGGGRCYFSAFYDVETDKLMKFTFNAER